MPETETKDSPKPAKGAKLSDEMRRFLMKRRQVLLSELTDIEEQLEVYHRCKDCKQRMTA